MTLDARIDANRQNARRSTGPRTVAGKRAASQNALNHGLDARSPVIPTLEDPAAWDTHLASTLAGLAPARPLENTLAERAALLLWRLGRVARYERAVTANAQNKAPEGAALGERDDLPRGAASGPARLRALTNLAHLPDDHPVTCGAASCVVSAVAERVRAFDSAFDAQSFVASFLARHEPTPDAPSGWTAGLVRAIIDAIAAHERRDPATLLTDALASARTAASRERSAARRIKRRADQLRRERILPAPAMLDKVIRYETHLTRQLDHTLAQLRRLQHTRRTDANARPTDPNTRFTEPYAACPAPADIARARERTQPPPSHTDPATTAHHPATTEHVEPPTFLKPNTTYGPLLHATPEHAEAGVGG